MLNFAARCAHVQAMLYSREASYFKRYIHEERALNGVDAPPPRPGKEAFTENSAQQPMFHALRDSHCEPTLPAV